MVLSAEKHCGPVYAQENDPRVTSFGRFMRRCRIDELPQLWNVLRGEMSLIGPRPERECFTTSLQKKCALYNWRHLVRPGITGWAQINYQYGTSDEDSIVKLQYDLFYLKNASLLLKLEVLIGSVVTVLTGRGAQ